MKECPKIQEILNDYMDKALSTDDASAVEAHLARCPECGHVQAELARLLDGADALPESIEPATDLWPGIEGRIREATGGKKPLPDTGTGWGLHMGWALAAAALIVLSVGLTFLYLRGDPSAGSAHTRIAPAFTGPQTELVGYDETETQYTKARTELLDVLRDRWDLLSPETREVVDTNLAVINEALRNIKAALEEDPGNMELQDLLKKTYQKEQDLLMRVRNLPADV